MTARAVVLAGLLIGSPLAWAASLQATPATYRGVLARLVAGDVLSLAPGIYTRNLPLHQLAGTAARPIVIAAADPADKPVFVAHAGVNTLSLRNVRHLVVRDLVLEGRGQPVDAVKAEGDSAYADFVTLENLTIRDYAASQQNVGISTKCPAFGWIVRNNTIQRVGTGMYFGDADGSDPFVGGLIVANRVTDVRGYALQIKHRDSGVAAYPGTHDTVIRDNVFSKSDDAQALQARPNVLLGHGPRTGAARADRIVMVGNVLRNNPHEALLQAEGRLWLHDNVFVNVWGDAIHIQPHHDVPRTMRLSSNTVVAAGVGIRIRTGGSPARQQLDNNLIAAGTAWRGGEATDNVALPYRASEARLPTPALVQALWARMPGLAATRSGRAWPGAQPGPAWAGARATP